MTTDVQNLTDATNALLAQINTSTVTLAAAAPAAAASAAAAAASAAQATAVATGGAGGVLSGNYPNPGFAVDMATQAELDAAVATIPAKFSELSTITGATVITVNLQTKLITTSAVRDIYSSNRGFGYIAANQSVAFTAAIPGAIMMLYVTTAEVVGIAYLSSLPPDTAALIGYLYGEKFYGISPSGSVLVVSSSGAANNQTSGIAAHRPNDGVVLSAGAITINWQTKQITQVGSSFVQGVDGYIGIVAQTVSFTAASDVTPAWLYVLPNGVLGAVQVPYRPPPTATIMARIYNNKIYSNAPYRNITLVTAAGVSVPDYASGITAQLTGELTVAINMATGLMTTSGSSGIAIWDVNYIAVAGGQSVSFSTTNPTYNRWVSVNKITGAISLNVYPTRPSTATDVIVATLYNGHVYHTSKRSVFQFTNATGELVTDDDAAVFVETQTRAILADDIYLPSTGSLPLYRASCFSNYRVALADQVKFWLNGGQTTPNAKTFRDIREVIEMVPAELASTFELSYRHDANPDVRYIKPITKHAASAGALSGRSFKMLTIGDSLTEGGMAAAIKAKLVALGAAITTVGTYSSAITVGEIGEGRGYWAWRCFIGKCNNTGGQAISLPSAGTTTTKFQNPFLRLATGTDTTAHPTWCFRNTGAIKENDFASDPSPGTGNFYIFDFANYLSSRSVAAPDVITIGLSTNDIQLDNASYTRAERLAAMRLSLDIMVSQIRAALPTVPIAIIPAPAWSSTTQGETYEAEVCDWIENCMTDIRGRSDANLYVVPVWQHMARDWIYPTTYVDLSATSKVRKATVSDLIHFGPVGLDQYTQVVAAWAEAVL